MRCLINDFIKEHDIKLNVADLCRWAGISRAAYYKIVNDNAIPRLNTAFSICDYFNKILFYNVTVMDLWK